MLMKFLNGDFFEYLYVEGLLNIFLKQILSKIIEKMFRVSLKQPIKYIHFTMGDPVDYTNNTLVVLEEFYFLLSKFLIPFALNLHLLVRNPLIFLKDLLIVLKSEMKMLQLSLCYMVYHVEMVFLNGKNNYFYIEKWTFKIMCEVCYRAKRDKKEAT